MIDGLQGEEIFVRCASFEGRDAYGNTTRSLGDPVEVDDVLVAPGDPASDIEDGRPNGTRVDLTLYVPSGSGLDWRGAEVEVRGHTYSVVGSPQEYTPGTVPTGRDLVVKATRREG